ncbi:hypothetical protein SCHPADRAFT_938602 [Schizopora paradoxa]|uniref:DUF6534 domain-containing protein n=1 Tax=Schizopora paradoxa TaxID=27342 RepID=A0A0H2RUC3_9AGAM|nr:hypothetical protein SCHPADRAFT_938602 [Schizopora paradoxa]
MSLEPRAFSVLDQTGPLFIGIILNYFFFGILIHQLYDYNKNYPNDKWPIRWMVYIVCILDMLQTGFTTQFAWFYCIQNWGNFDVFTTSATFAWTASFMPIMAGLISMIVQFFYAWRIWVLGGRWLRMISAAIGVIAFTQSLCALIGGIMYDVLGFDVAPPSTVPYFTVWLAGSFTADVLIAGSMTIIFVKVKTRSSYDKTNNVINTLIRHVVETAAITAVAAGVDIVLFITSRNQTQGYTDPALVLGKLYTNCLLANLNNRRNLMSSSDSEGSGNIINSFRLRKLVPTSFNDNKQNVTAIRVDQVHHIQRDGGESIMEPSHVADSKLPEQETSYVKDDASDAFSYKAEAIAV